MDFGKLPNVDRVDFRLPLPPAPQDHRTLAVLSRYREATPPTIRVGCPVWAQREWLGKIYPLAAKPPEFLRHYSRQFGMIELNTTYYRIPAPEQVTEWREQTPAGFRFCPKWPQEISHHHGLQNCEALTAMFCESLSRLEDRLSSSFLQLPPGFSPQQLPTLKRFLATVPRDFPICVEFRQPDWFKDHALIPAALDVLEAAGVGTVITDVAGRRDVAHLSLTSSRVLIRFIGNALHASDYQRLDDWMPRLKLWLDSGLRELDFCTHEHDNILAPELAKAFVERINSQVGTQLQSWAPMEQGKQLGLFG